MKAQNTSKHGLVSGWHRSVRAILFDLGDTLIYERVDDISSLDKMTLHLRPHAAEILERLSHVLKIGLVSDTNSSSEPAVRSALKALGVEGFFSAVVTSTDVGVTKPDSRIFLEALRQMAADAQETVMVGNDPIRDIYGADQLGMVTILFRPTKYFEPGSEKDANYSVDSLLEIPSIIQSLI